MSYVLYISQDNIVDCVDERSMYPVGFTNCHFHGFRDNIALVDCGNELISDFLYVCIIVALVELHVYIHVHIYFKSSHIDNCMYIRV